MYQITKQIGYLVKQKLFNNARGKCKNAWDIKKSGSDQLHKVLYKIFILRVALWKWMGHGPNAS